MTDMARAVRIARAATGLSQAELGELAGVHPTAVSRLESGAREPKMPAIDKVAKALGIPIDVLLAFGVTEEDGSFPDKGLRLLQWLASQARAKRGAV